MSYDTHGKPLIDDKSFITHILAVLQHIDAEDPLRWCTKCHSDVKKINEMQAIVLVGQTNALQRSCMFILDVSAVNYWRLHIDEYPDTNPIANRCSVIPFIWFFKLESMPTEDALDSSVSTNVSKSRCQHCSIVNCELKRNVFTLQFKSLCTDAIRSTLWVLCECRCGQFTVLIEMPIKFGARPRIESCSRLVVMLQVSFCLDEP